jgi:hypothetical protein
MQFVALEYQVVQKINPNGVFIERRRRWKEEAGSVQTTKNIWWRI